MVVVGVSAGTAAMWSADLVVVARAYKPGFKLKASCDFIGLNSLKLGAFKPRVRVRACTGPPCGALLSSSRSKRAADAASSGLGGCCRLSGQRLGRAVGGGQPETEHSPQDVGRCKLHKNKGSY